MARLDDGYSTIIVFSLNPLARVYEKTVTPPSYIGRGAIDVTTMRNRFVLSKSPKKLVDFGNVVLTVAYDVQAYVDMSLMLAINQSMAVVFPDLSYVGFYGWIDEWKPHELKEGEQPTAEMTIILSNQKIIGGLIFAPVVGPAGAGIPAFPL